MIDEIETPYKWAMMIREPMAAWSKGRITLLGDACHPTLPFLGQGGVMSIEDGYVVAACLDKYFGEPEVAFARYEDIRKDRTSMVVRKASENKKSAFEPRLADKDLVAVEVAREWQQVRAPRADGLAVQLRRHGDRDLTIRDDHSPPACCGRHRLSRLSSICTIAVIASDSAANTIRPENTTST